MTDHPLDDRIEGLSLMLDLDAGIQRALLATLKDVGCIGATNKGDQLYCEGETSANEGYVVLKGSLLIESKTGFSSTLFAPVLVGEMKQFSFGDDDARAASVTASVDLEVLRFDWDAFYKSLGAQLSEAQLEEFRCALRRYAWMHFLELEGEL